MMVMHCAFCGCPEHDPARLKSMERAPELFDRGQIRPAEERPWVFCFACRSHFGRERDKRA
jgi:hypothetical protein